MSVLISGFSIPKIHSDLTEILKFILFVEYQPVLPRNKDISTMNQAINMVPELNMAKSKKSLC